jgi:SAM-dependent methyltransferase
VTSMPLPCPLCTHPETALAAHGGGQGEGRGGGRELLDCPVCGLLSAPPGERPDAGQERARYETHENDPGDPRYRAFLDRLVRPLGERLRPGARGLDYGSGPGPTLSLMMTEQGFPCAQWDPFFAPDPAPLDAGPYDFVTCTETVEHFHEPGREFQRLAGLVRPGGWLGIMTDPVPDTGIPPNWYYLRDPTHVSFYRERTLGWIGARFGWVMERPERRVILYRTGAGGAVRPGSS